MLRRGRRAACAAGVATTRGHGQSGTTAVANTAEISRRIAAVVLRATPSGRRGLPAPRVATTLGERRVVDLVDDAALAQVGEARVVEPELLAQHRLGVLADARRVRLRALRHLRQLHRITGHDHRLLDAVGARDIDEHVAGRDQRIGDDVLGGVARAGSDAVVGEHVAHLEAGPARGPRLDGGADHVLHVRAPALTGREAFVGEPLGMADRVREPLELVLAADLDDEPAVARLEPVHDQRRLAAALEAHRPEVHDEVGHRDHRVVHRDVDVLALAGACRGGAARRARRSRRTAPSRCRRARRRG